MDNDIVMYLIVRQSLQMSIGKTVAQVGHAVEMISAKFQTEYVSTADAILYQKYLDTSYRKIVLRADEKEWEKIKEEFQDLMVLVIDNGLTELSPNTETVIGLFPQDRGKLSKTIKRLQLLK